ncbi:unnamed protein product, partial [Musa acuminata var. zebrina]
PTPTPTKAASNKSNEYDLTVANLIETKPAAADLHGRGEEEEEVSSHESTPDVANLVPGLLAGLPHHLHPLLHQVLQLLGSLLHLLLEASGHGDLSR